MTRTHHSLAPKQIEAPAARPLSPDKDIEDCIVACVACHRICLETVHHCLKAGGPRATARHIRSLLDCAELCQTAVRFMFANSAVQSRLCAMCAEACRACETACRDMAEPQDLRCAEACACCSVMLHQAHSVLDERSLGDGW